MEWEGLWYGTHRDVYEPSDDTFLLAQVVGERVAFDDRFLEVGCGAGLVSMAAARTGATVTCTDANPAAVHLANRNAAANGRRLDGVVTDLLAGLAGPFDVVAFNPPYLPTDDDEHVEGLLDLAFDGGPSGNDVVLRFAEQLGELSPLPREVLVVHSSLSDPKPLMRAMKALGYAHEQAAKERHFYETLWVRRFYLRR